MIRALYTGSFDPMTNGHLDIIRRAASLFDELVVGVIINPQKQGLFTKEERASQIREVTKDFPNVTVDCFQGLLADYVNEHGFDIVVRGIRSTKDFEYEIPMAQMNDRLFKSNTESVFLMTDPKYSFISSTMVKEVVSLGGDARGLVPDYILAKMEEKYGIKR
ncbi:MAG: pantetheine-phosphate adenylyltransferase [Eubacteriales bacterium]|nr:pantetheine-phosphate adenylyltransferase [Eubacteriales bacterium]